MPEWLCDCVTEWLCDWVTVWLSDCVTVWLSDCVTEWLCDWVTVWLCDWVTVWLSDWLTQWWACRLANNRLISQPKDWLTDHPISKSQFVSLQGQRRYLNLTAASSTFLSSTSLNFVRTGNSFCWSSSVHSSKTSRDIGNFTSCFLNYIKSTQ